MQRLYTLTGGVEPQEVNRAERTLVVETKGLPEAFLSDVIFTDVGLLIFPYGVVHVTPGIQKATLFIGGGVVMGIAQDLEDRKNLKRIERAYDENAPMERGLSLIRRFCARGTFFPADEISQIESAEDVGMSFHFRNANYRFTCPFPQRDLESWRGKAAAKRASLDGGPADGGLPALFEWALRPSQATAMWVTAAIETAVDAPIRLLNNGCLSAARCFHEITI